MFQERLHARARVLGAEHLDERLALEVEARFKVDPTRRYITGLSSGAAMSVVAGILLVLGIILAVGAVTVGRKEPPVVAAETPKPVGTTDITTAPTEEKIPLAAPQPLGFTESPPTQPVTSDDVEALFAIGEQFARLPNTGIESVDNVLRSLAPKAEDAARETVVHAANLVRYGDRSTMLATLGVALAIGWAMTRLRPRHEA